MNSHIEDRFELALKASNEGVWDWNLIDDSIFYSERNMSFLGFDSGVVENIFVHPEFWVHSDDIIRFKKELENIYRKNGAETCAIDTRFVKPKGEVIWLRVRGVIVRNKDGEAERVVGSMIDITLRKTAEAELEEERHRLRLLIDNIHDNVYFKNRDSAFVMANIATAEKLGCSSVKEIIGKTDHEFFDHRHADKSRSDEIDIMKTDESHHDVIEQETWMKGKEETWVITSKIPWKDRNGDIRGTFGISRDVTDLVITQRKLLETTHVLTQQKNAMDEEMELARQIQLAMVKEEQLKKVECSESKRGANFAYRYVPVSEMAGDFYQVIKISEEKVGVFICDVMGHGVRSALIVSMLRGLMEKEKEFIDDPQKYLTGLNQSLSTIFQSAGMTMFATAFYAVIDLRNETLSYCNAGHPSPLMVSGDKVSLLSDHNSVRGPALGLVEGAEYPQGVIQLEKFNKLIAYTDGIYEITDKEGEEMGVSRLMKLLEESEVNLDSDLESLLDAAREFSGDGEYGDDVCLVGVEMIHA